MSPPVIIALISCTFTVIVAILGVAYKIGRVVESGQERISGNMVLVAQALEPLKSIPERMRGVETSLESHRDEDERNFKRLEDTVLRFQRV